MCVQIHDILSRYVTRKFILLLDMKDYYFKSLPLLIIFNYCVNAIQSSIINNIWVPVTGTVSREKSRRNERLGWRDFDVYYSAILFG